MCTPICFRCGEFYTPLVRLSMHNLEKLKNVFSIFVCNERMDVTTYLWKSQIPNSYKTEFIITKYFFTFYRKHDKIIYFF